MKITNQFKSRLRTYFVKRLSAFDYKHGWMRIPTCPYCGREQKLGVNLSMYRTNCFRCNAHPSPAQLIMDIEGFTEYHELINFLNNGQFDELQFKEEKIELAESKPLYLPEGFRNISIGDSHLQKVLGDISRNVGFNPDQFSRFGIGYGTMGTTYGTLSSRSIIKDNLNITMLGTLSEKVPGIIIPIKISQALANNLSSLIMTHWKCTGRYSFAREHLMLSQWAIEELPQWAKLLVSTKSMNYLNPNAKDILYSWTQTPSNMQSIWRSNLLPIKGQGGVFTRRKGLQRSWEKGSLKVSI